MTVKPRVLLADDHEMLLAAYEKLLGSECTIVGQVTDGRAVVAATESLKPDVVVLDISMPFLNGLEAARQIKQRVPDARLIFLTMNEDPDIAVEAFRVGASAYVLKRSAASELSAAIREVVSGCSYITPLVAQGLVHALLQQRRDTPGPELTTRQREVLSLIAEGRSAKEIAALLHVTPRAISAHKHEIMEQLGVKSTAELIQYAIKHSIV